MARSILDAINAAAAELQNATMDSRNDAAQTTTHHEAVRPKVSPSGVKPKAKTASKGGTTAKPKAEPKAPSMAEAIAAAAAELGGQTKGSTTKPKGKAAAKDTPKTKGGKSAEKPKPIDINSLQCKYVIPEDFKMAIRLCMEGRAAKDNAIARKMKAAGKSIDGCCEYIYGVMMRRAAQQLTERKSTGIGLTGSPEEVYGLAMHYYDESEENLKAELNEREE